MDRNLVDEMRAWCADVFSSYPSSATDAEVVECVRRQYDGGLAGFMVDGGQYEVKAGA